MIIFDPSASGYGILSLQGAGVLLACFLLLSAVHPWILTLARIEGLSRGRLPLMGHDTASAGALTSGYLLRGPALLPGYAIFTGALLAALFPAYVATPSSAYTDMISGASGPAIGGLVLLAAFSGLLDSTPPSWRNPIVLQLGLALRILTVGWLLVCCYLVGGAPSTILMILASGFGARIAAGILGRARFLHGIRAVATAPAMLLAWGIVTAAVSVIGPLERLLRPFIDRSGGEGLDLGVARDVSLQNNSALLPACATLDSTQGMRLPR